MRRFDGLTACVTGAGGPMGFAVCRRLAAEGANLVLTDISARRLTETVAEIERSYPDCIVLSLRCNVTIPEEVAALFEHARAMMPLAVLVNVVGGIRDQQLSRPMADISRQRLQETLDLNVLSAFEVSRAFLAEPRPEGQAIVNITSVVFAGEPYQTDYSAAKAAVAGLTRAMALELSPRVRVNAVAPGPIATTVLERAPKEMIDDFIEKTPLKRIGTADDVAAAVAFLASSDAAHITGTILPVAGGLWPSL